TEDVAGDKPERRDGRTGEQNGAADVTEKCRGGFGQRRVFMMCRVGAEGGLCHELDENINGRRNDEREVSRTRYSACRVFHFAARDQCYFDPNEGEDQQNDGITQRLTSGPGVKCKMRRM